ncbi:IclR family transcriptional regulator [Corynebacterium sp.]|uniref:IclR family transcriptional regulator n=1 Tax=Corynebacterium sp. TaxID=1720 RepID=UPI0028B1D88C|nr:IclR family transcriptional regulator [Corynebacterium sp.]
MANSKSGETVLERCVRVLESFDIKHSTLTVSEISRRADLPMSTAHRMVSELVEVGLLDRADDKRLVMGRRAWEIFARTNPVEELRFRARPVLEGIHSAVQQFTSLAVPQFDDDEVLFIERYTRFGDAEIRATQGGRMDLFDNSNGIIFLAHAPFDVLERVFSKPMVSKTDGATYDLDVVQDQVEFARRNGYAKITNGMVRENVAYAVPLMGPDGQLVAALSVVGKAAECDDDVILTVLAASGNQLSHGEKPLVLPRIPRHGR